jgi:tRNA threonylcarbamoyladenosine biosynthesis protein TsaB
MRALGIDTTTPGGSLALSESNGLVGAVMGDARRTHGERLMTDIQALLKAHGWRIGDIDVYGVAAGPGSFTGLRIGIAAIQGLALATGRPVAPVSALDAMAMASASLPSNAEQLAGGSDLAVWMDAHRQEVFWARYTMDSSTPRSADLVLVEGPSVEPPSVVLGRWARRGGTSPILMVGDGALRYSTEIEDMLGARAHVAAQALLLAPVIARMALAAATDGRAVSPHAVRPLYVRRPDAELAREARARRS